MPGQEFSEREQELITRLREKGPEDPETRKMFGAWCEVEEAEAMKTNTSRANIEVQLKRAKFYRAAGGNDSAWQTLGAVCEAAISDESAGDLYREALALADEMRREFGEQVISE